MAVVVDIPARSAIREAQIVRVRAEIEGGTSILAHTTTNDIATALEEKIATGTDGLSIKMAAEQLLAMSEAERMEALGIDEDDPKSYLAAVYSPAA